MEKLMFAELKPGIVLSMYRISEKRSDHTKNIILSFGKPCDLLRRYQKKRYKLYTLSQACKIFAFCMKNKDLLKTLKIK